MTGLASVLSVGTDLLFGTKIASTAQALAVPCVGVRSIATLRDRIAGAKLVIVDLEAELPDGDPLAAIAIAKEAGVPIVAFGSHLATELLGAARTAGADRVLARSGFTVQLPTILMGAAG